jgi:hypothetical protein
MRHFRKNKRRWKAGSAVTHQTASVARVENPGNGFCQAAGRVDDAWDVDQLKVASLLPILDGKVLDHVNMTRTKNE